MLSQELDSIIYAVDTSNEIKEPFKSNLIRNLKSSRDTARNMEEKIIIQANDEQSVA